MRIRTSKLIIYIFSLLILEVVIFFICYFFTLKRVSPDFLYNPSTYESLMVLKTQENLNIEELNNLYKYYFLDENLFYIVSKNFSYKISKSKSQALKIYFLRLRILDLDAYYDISWIDKDSLSVISELNKFNIELWNTGFSSLSFDISPNSTTSKKFISKELTKFLSNEISKK